MSNIDRFMSDWSITLAEIMGLGSPECAIMVYNEHY